MIATARVIVIKLSGNMQLKAMVVNNEKTPIYSRSQIKGPDMKSEVNSKDNHIHNKTMHVKQI